MTVYKTEFGFVIGCGLYSLSTDACYKYCLARTNNFQCKTCVCHSQGPWKNSWKKFLSVKTKTMEKTTVKSGLCIILNED